MSKCDEIGFLEDLCLVVSSGGYLDDVAELRGIGKSEVRKWLMDKPERMQKYNDALMVRESALVERLVKELRSMALVDVGRAYNEDGTLKAMSDIPEDVRRAIVSVETVELAEGMGVVKKVKFSDKLKGIELLGKQMQMFVDRTRVEHVVTLEDLVSRSVIDVTNDVKELPHG